MAGIQPINTSFLTDTSAARFSGQQISEGLGSLAKGLSKRFDNKKKDKIREDAVSRDKLIRQQAQDNKDREHLFKENVQETKANNLLIERLYKIKPEHGNAAFLKLHGEDLSQLGIDVSEILDSTPNITNVTKQINDLLNGRTGIKTSTKRMSAAFDLVASLTSMPKEQKDLLIKKIELFETIKAGNDLDREAGRIKGDSTARFTDLTPEEQDLAKDRAAEQAGKVKEKESEGFGKGQRSRRPSDRVLETIIRTDTFGPANPASNADLDKGLADGTFIRSTMPIRTALASVDRMEKVMGSIATLAHKVFTSDKFVAFSERGTLYAAKFFGTNEDFKLYDTQVKANLGNMRDAFTKEKGIMTEDDATRMESFFPIAGDSRSLANKKVSFMFELLDLAKREQIMILTGRPIKSARKRFDTMMSAFEDDINEAEQLEVTDKPLTPAPTTTTTPTPTQQEFNSKTPRERLRLLDELDALDAKAAQ